MNRIIQYFKTLEEKEATKFLIIFYIVGVVGFLIPQTREIFERLIPVSLIINIFMLFLFHKVFNLKHLVFFVSIIVVTIAIEAVGVQTGILFGEYDYGKSIPVKVFGTPVLIGFNWLMLTYGAVFLLRTKKALRKFLPVLTGVLMTGFDYIMEPVAMKADMWTWMFNDIPYQNYIMWFVIATVIGGCFELFNINTDNKIAGRIFVLQLVFFGILNIFLP
ncbi:MAG: carotenoid biosynthesis protein [Prolixibacteraceae bacterium]|jgi:putative membrane protein|nr:carotenoid biosynthesis protein [Prolixibacteraceae bacterium]